VITYCTNIHPGESWDDTFSNLKRHLPAVKAAVSPGALFPVGLRLSARAAQECDARAAAEFGRWLELNGLFVPTINAFPFGSFHSAPVKERVYLPDWRHAERVDYTLKLAALLDAWLPQGCLGSLSTVPIAFRNGFDEADLPAVRKNLLSVLEELDRLFQKSGKRILLALEPEPCCLLETVADAVQFFQRMDFPEELRQGLGVCLDCCHHAVEFEDPAQALAALARAGIPIAKVQVSSAPRLEAPGPELLALFDEPCYLHQVVIRGPAGELSRYSDLPDALQAHPARPGEEWRVHFHIPIFTDQTESFGTTRSFIEETLPLLDESILLEVETYTFDVLPKELRKESVTESIIREIQWLQGVRSDAAQRRP